MLTKDIWLPTEEELTVQEVPLGTPSLRAGAMHLGKACEVQNNEFMLCRGETQDPRFCKIILNITFHFNTIPFLHITFKQLFLRPLSVTYFQFSFDVYYIFNNTIGNTRHALIFSCQINIFSFTAF